VATAERKQRARKREQGATMVTLLNAPKSDKSKMDHRHSFVATRALGERWSIVSDSAFHEAGDDYKTAGRSPPLSVDLHSPDGDVASGDPWRIGRCGAFGGQAHHRPQWPHRNWKDGAAARARVPDHLRGQEAPEPRSAFSVQTLCPCCSLDRCRPRTSGDRHPPLHGSPNCNLTLP